MRPDKFHPGWKMTTAQHRAYWSWIQRVAQATGEARETARQAVHLQAFGGPKSAKTINHLRDFDDFVAACKAIVQPANLDAQMRQAEMPRTRLIYAIRQLAPEAYVIEEAGRKFGGVDWETLDESSLTMLRNHLAARAANIRWPAQQPASRAERAELVAVEAGDPDWTV